MLHCCSLHWKSTLNLFFLFYAQLYHIPWINMPVRTAIAIWHQLTKYEVRICSAFKNVQLPLIHIYICLEFVQFHLL